MIIWRNEADTRGYAVMKDPPPGPVEIIGVEDTGEGYRVVFAPVPATPAGDMPPDPVGMLTGMAGIHHEWYEAWKAAGFTEERAFELVLGMVSAAFTQG